MPAFSKAQNRELQARLQQAVLDCSARGLSQASKWAAELLNSFPKPDEMDDDDEDDEMGSPTADIAAQLRDEALEDGWDLELEKAEMPRYLLAKTYFDCREFDRCANVFVSSIPPKIPYTAPPAPNKAQWSPQKGGKGRALGPHSSSKTHVREKEISRKSLFLSLYAKYLAGEKRKDEQSEMILGPADGGQTKNKELGEVSSVLEHWFFDHPNHDGGGWLEYLYGVVLAKGKNEAMAKLYLIKSVHLNPYNWAAWDELMSLFETHEDLVEILDKLPQNIMTLIFNVYASQELFTVSDAILEQLDRLLNVFPHSAFLKSQQALLHYHIKDFESSWTLFADLIRKDPYRLDSLDVFSNVLYVLGNRPMLTFLAQLATLTDKFRPETCCIVGNYYSLLSEHEKATMYFRRALSLDRSFSAAWTLMGHEYVEMKNTHAAIESYRRAIEASRRDYRAWYGLGQTYEFLEMQVYALSYYQRAASLRPFDPKMWGAIGTCYARTGKLEYAIKAYKRALVAGSYYDGGAGAFGASGSGTPGFDGGGGGALGPGILDPEVLYQIAVLYERLGDTEETAAYMELVLTQEDGPVVGEGVDAAGRAVGPSDSKNPDKGAITAGPGEDGNVTGSGSGDGTLIPGPIGGVGVTPTTSKARMWLAKWEFTRRNYGRAQRLATELCQDGVDVDEAKALVRDIQARVERIASMSTGAGAGGVAVGGAGPRNPSRSRRDRSQRRGGADLRLPGGWE